MYFNINSQHSYSTDLFGPEGMDSWGPGLNPEPNRNLLHYNWFVAHSSQPASQSHPLVAVLRNFETLKLKAFNCYIYLY